MHRAHFFANVANEAFIQVVTKKIFLLRYFAVIGKNPTDQ